MGYAAEKKSADKKWKKAKIIVLISVLCALVVGVVLSIFLPPWSWKYRVALPSVGERADGQLRIHFIDVGQGDATVIELPDGKIALIDGGDASKETEYAVMRYLHALDVQTIDYLIITHADEDHLGALDVVLENTTVKNAYLPLVKQTVNTQYAQFYAALLEEGCAYTYAKNGIDLSGDDYTFTFLHPFVYDIENALANGETYDDATNETSAVLWLEYEGVAALFTGDLPADREAVLAQSSALGLIEADFAKTKILKVGHHGSKNSTSETLLTALKNLDTAVISCGENTYGHPDEETLARLDEREIAVYRTDLRGNIVAIIEKGGACKMQTQNNG